MARRRARHRSEGAPEDDDGEEEEEVPDLPIRRPGSRPPDRTPVRPWSGPAEDGGEEQAETDTPRFWRRAKRPVFFRARDSLFFEPLVALAIIVLLLVSLYAYTQNWPPMYVVESSSMQHGTNDILGLINTGDLVLAQHLDSSGIVPYEEGVQTGYSTYGEFGDVILYHPYGVTGPVPIIHRAILYLEANSDTTYNAPALGGLACSATSHPYYRDSSTVTGCGTSHLSGSIVLEHVGWQDANVTVSLSGIGRTSGFVTMGDNNYFPGSGGSTAVGEPDQPALTTLVQNGWIVGVARGMIPWFGATKLLLEGQAGEVPSQSWEYMGLTIVGVGLLAYGVHYALRAEGIEDERRKEWEAEEAGSGSDETHSRWRGLRRWGSKPAEGDASSEELRSSRHSSQRSNTARVRVRFRKGRPHPEVRKVERRASRNRSRREAPAELDDEL